MSAQYETFGKYVLLEKLATGGMAEVFLARGTGAGGIGKFFAIKRILPQYADSPEFIEMFKDEAKIAINLNHSNIVSIHEFGVEKGQFFLVMDYVEGRNLRQILNKMKKSGLQFSVDQIVYMIKEVAAGLDHAHRCIDGSTGRPLNITHRDMSPQNVMVSFEGETKIVDFGIAKAESQIETTRAGTLKGKFGYMSPEQAEGQPVDLRTDIFSLGIVMWELLANDRLFVANNEINTLRKIRDCQIPSLRKINPNIHTELERIVQKALARDRNLRYQTGAALHRDLNRFLNRQYPDFSPQDFSVFIKSVFADEILSLRKRLVEYAKVNLSISLNIPKNNFDDRSGMLKTSTNSLVVSHSQVKEVSGITASDISDSQVGEVNERTEVTQADSDLVSVPSTKLTATLEVADITKTQPSDPAIPPQINEADLKRPAAAQKPKALLDEAALAAELQAPRPMGRAKVQPMSPPKEAPSENQRMLNPDDSKGVIETEDVTSPSIRSNTRMSRTNSRINIDNYQPKPARFATFLVFALLCTSVYSYLVKYYPAQMCDVISTTHMVLAPLHNALGVQECNRFPTNTTDSTSTKPVTPPPPSQIYDEAAPDKVFVKSNPSGAEIWLNGQHTGKTTPSQVDIVPGELFTLTLRKRGYAEYKRADVTREQLGYMIDVPLQKMNIGYLDVEIFPPQEATLYVNGKQVFLNRTFARDIIVPANTPIKVRAESRVANTYEEQTISVQLDRKRAIKLNPRKNTRAPSGGAK